MIAAIRPPVLDRLGQVWLPDILLPGQIGYGPRHLQNATVCAGRKPEPIGDHLQQLLSLIIEGTKLADMAGGHGGVGVQAVGGKALGLKLSGALHPGADDFRRFAVARVGEVPVRDPWYFDVQINPVEQRPGKSLPVALDIVRCAST